jgi:acyl-CoA synthetase (AMP-forming)/AMP-acid ligase II/alkylation response protein AidB-like acyl-CoA dehydrogenase/acyl carrier protein
MVVSKERFLTIRYKAATLVDILQMQVDEQPNSVGYNFWQTSESLTYQELDCKARAIAVYLQQRYQPQERVLLMYPPSLELIAGIMGCMYAGLIAVPVYPPRRNRNLERVLAISQDASASAILTDLATEKLIGAVGSIPIIASDDISLDSDTWQRPNISSDSIALLQYTSGSTGAPKGVMLSHGNLLHNLEQIYNCFGHSPSSHGVIWLPPYHDMGLMGGIFQPLYGGFPVTLMAPVTFLQKPVRWLQAISQTHATTSGAPNFAYEMCLNIRPEECQNLDLSSWELAFTGAEPVRAQTLTKFTHTFAPYGFRPEAFYPCYGLAEATLFVTGGQKHKAPTIKSDIVSCGNICDGKIIIVDPQSLEQCDTGKEGEIWVKSLSVAQGYWRRPLETEQTFKVGGEFLRTGDLGILEDGELFVTGRIKDMILIRGCNYYPQDIEATVAQSHEMLAHWGAAFSIEVQNEEKLVIVQEVSRNSWRQLDTTSIVTAIRTAVSQEHELQVYAICLLKPSSIPKTSSGKVKRYACKTEFVNNTLEVLYKWELAPESVLTSPPTPLLLGEGSDETFITPPSITPPSITPPSITPPSLGGKGDGGLGSTSDKLIYWLRDYANHHINSQLMDERRCISPHIVLDFGNQGLLGMQVPKEYGGIGLGHTETIRIIQQLGAIDPTLALFVGLNNVLGIRPILKYGATNLKEELLPILATGRELAAFALTEPGAGANPQAITSQVIDDGNNWRLRGQKIWSGSAAWAGVINIFVRHGQGISGFAVRRGSKGLRQGAEALTMGMRGMVQNTIYLEDITVQADQLLGSVGAGMSVAQDAMMYGRLAIAAACVGGMKRCVQLMHRYSTRRHIATGRLLDHPIVLNNLDEIINAITAVESLVMFIGELLDQGINVPIEAYTACKISAPEFYWQAADVLVQTLGGRGYIETNMAPQILRDARILRIFEGPTETLCSYLGARILKQGDTLQHFLAYTLGQKDIAQQLTKATQQINDKFNQTHPDTITIQRWIYHQLGELATDAILGAVMLRNKAAQRSITWIKNRFDQKLDKILAATPIIKPDTANFLDKYIEAIGDIQQTAPGEDYQQDELLTNNTINKPIDPPKQQTQETPNTSSSKELQTWLISWLSKKLYIKPSDIDPRKTFASYGIDSVTAVELAQDIQEYLNTSEPLEATIAWNYPTIEDLANYLSQEKSIPSCHAEERSISETSNLEELSATEMAELLAQEIAIARQRAKNKPNM